MVHLDKVPSAVLMPNKAWCFMENNACVVTERVSISFCEISSGSEASSLLFFFFSCRTSWHGTKSNINYFSEEIITTTVEPLFFSKLLRENVGGKTC